MVTGSERGIGSPSSLQRERIATWLGLALLLVLQCIALIRQRPPHLEDDGAFFLRYAENIAAGNGYRWNPGEAPVWGASAPLWPLFLASGLAAGLAPVAATLFWSVPLTLAATLILGLTARRLFGLYGLLALAPLISINFLYSTWATSGLESPLTFLLVALALYAASSNAGGIACGVVAGLCLVHKVDLAPLGMTLLFSLAVWRRERFWRALAVASAIAAVGYGLATWYFDTPVPNSFLHKLNSKQQPLSSSWFANVALFARAGWVRLPLLALGAFALRRRPEVAIVALAAVFVPTLAYTLKPPTEGFLWYPAAISGAIAFLAAGGLAFLLERIPSRPWTHVRPIAATCVLLLVGVVLEREEMPVVRNWHRFLASTIPVMRAGGEWVDEHLPADARVLTWWGHPALASHRFVYDGTLLNRRPEVGDLRVKYQPEAVIQLVKVSLESFRVPPGYRQAQLFLAPEVRGVAFKGVAVLVRDGVPIDGVIEPPPPRRGWAVALARQLLGEAQDEMPAYDRHRLAALAELVAQRRERPDAPRWLDELEGRIREVQAALDDERPGTVRR